MKTNSISVGLTTAVLGKLFCSMNIAEQDRVVLQTYIIETFLAPEPAEALSWHRVSPEGLAMLRSAVRSGAKGCEIFI